MDKHLKLRSKTLKMRCFFLPFRIIFVSLQPIYNSFSTTLVILLGIKKLKFHSIKQSLIGVFGRR